ncbi:unnamed protein product [Boreogadus saida]
MSRRKQAKPRSVKAVEDGESSECGGTWDESNVQTDVPAAEAEAEAKLRRGGGLPDEDHDEPNDLDPDDDLDDESIFTCDNCQQDFECLAELTEHRTHHCPAGHLSTVSLFFCILVSCPSSVLSSHVLRCSSVWVLGSFWWRAGVYGSRRVSVQYGKSLGIHKPSHICVRVLSNHWSARQLIGATRSDVTSTTML